MFLRPRLLSAGHGGGAVLLAAMFALGLGVGATIRPLIADVRDVSISASAAPTAAGRAVPGTGPLRVAHPAEVLRVIDGDTFEARVHIWPGLDVTTRVRLRGIDAPELKARCPEERDRAEAARDALRAVLDQGEVAIARVTLDKYGGRVVADASTHATPDVASALLDAGVARRYAGGRRQGWCFQESGIRNQ
jgi:endonuclease YncB( thermonuclease family)